MILFEIDDTFSSGLTWLTSNKWEVQVYRVNWTE